MSILQKIRKDNKVSDLIYNQKVINYDSVSSIVEMIEQKSVSINNLLKENKQGVVKGNITAVVLSYVDSVVLPLTALHVEMLVDWIVSDYDHYTKTGGAKGYSIQDIHFVFRMGLTGAFGEPSGHKYILPNIIGKKGWFDQYHAIREKQMGDYFEKKNKALSENQNYDLSKLVSSPNASESLKELEKNKGKFQKDLREYKKRPKDTRQLSKLDKEEVIKIVNK